VGKITDISTIFGILSALALAGFAIYLNASEGSGGAGGFLNVESLLIVVGGTFFLTTACYSFSEVFKANTLLFQTIFYNSEQPKSAGMAALSVAETARRKGILSLQRHDDLRHNDSFFTRGISLVIDGVPHEEVGKIMENEIASTAERHRKSTSIVKRASEIAPAMGLIGTLIGLVQMLGNLSDPSAIGPSMAVALLTTLYGAVLSYMVLMPLASKLERNSRAEILVMDIYLNAVLSVGKKENPRRLEMLINAILPPAERVAYFS